MSLAPMLANAEKGRHYEFIKAAVSEPFKTATLDRGKALAATPVITDSWFSRLHPGTLANLSRANLRAWHSQNSVDRLMSKADLYTFAKPLLETKIKKRHGVDIDVQQTWLRLYRTGSSARTVSLLDAALHNFAYDETADPDSSYISKPDQFGRFDVLTLARTMTVGQFQALCRDLDIGALYKTHLETLLKPSEPLARGVLRARINASQEDALANAALMALHKGDLALDAYEMITKLINGEKRPLLGDLPVRCCDVSMLDTPLTGVLWILHGALDSRGQRRLIAYVPHDPDHPLKDYASRETCIAEMTRQLREDRLSKTTGQTYRQFFSQFVEHKQRGHFFATLKQQLFTAQFFPPKDRTDQGPYWRDVPVEKPRLKFVHLQIRGDYWRHAYQQKLDKIFKDAAQLAVSTADADSVARQAWWDNFHKILKEIFQVALFVATPFVPGLGEVMMVYTAYQLTSEVIEGIVDLAEGQKLEAAEHIISVVTDVIQLAAFSAGAQIGEVFRVKLSALVDDMLPVKLPDGKPSLWQPDLAPYAHEDLTLPSESKPDKQGLHQHERGQILPLDDKLYVVEKASNDPASKTHRIKHPQRANAYRPRVEHNSHGAWLHEAENPLNWPDGKLMQRLGHSVERFTPTQREEIRRSSGTTHNELRHMHSENSPPPPLLADTVKRFSAHDDVLEAMAKIRTGEPIDAPVVWLEPMLTSLPGWPAARALEVFASPELTGYSRKYGNAMASSADTLSISLADINAGRLPERVAGFLSDDEFSTLLGPDVSAQQRVPALRDRLADAVHLRRRDVVQHIYQAGEHGGNGELRVVRQAFPELPLPLAEKVVVQARPGELQRIEIEQRLPLRLKNEARELDFEASTSRAYEGFYHDDQLTAQTERLALNTLRMNTDAFANVRIEVFDGSAAGPLRSSVGPEDARTVRRLVRGEKGRYEVLDSNGQSLHEGTDFHEAILRALPEDSLSKIGYRPGQGRVLKAWLMDQCALPAERRSLLAQPPIREVVPRETDRLARGWSWLWGEPSPEESIRKLYPKLNDREVATFVRVLESKGDARQAVSALANERKALNSLLDNWAESYPPEIEDGHYVGVSSVYRLKGGRHIEERLKACFSRESEIFGEYSHHPEQGYTLDLASEILPVNSEPWWRDLLRVRGITPYLEQITALRVDNTTLSARDGLLSSFPNLRQLSASGCDLKEIPVSIGQMHQLEILDLSDNSIELTVDSRNRLGALGRLRTLSLTNNNLRVPPDIGAMDHLVELNLADTNIRDWPEGLFEADGQPKQRPKGFRLDLRKNPIDNLPEVEPGSDQARIVARTRFDASTLTDEQRVRYGNYRESVGLAGEQVYTAAASNELSYWTPPADYSSVFRPSSDFGRYREESWHDLMAEPDSAGFFSVIRKQRESADYQTHTGRQRLTRRVWEMVDAAALDTPLREQLFRQISTPDDCGDFGAQLFNSLGVKVLVSKAYSESTSPGVLEDRLVRLARSAARLKRVGSQANMEYSSQTQQHLINPNFAAPDEVEVHMAFETGLATRLELPWQSEDMLYQERSGVTPEKLDAAYQRILKEEQGDGLINAMIDPASDGFWEEYLRKAYPDRYQEHLRLHEEKPHLLDALREAQADWANETDHSRVNDRLRKLETCADRLGVPHNEVFTGQPMTDQTYLRLANKIGYEYDELSRALTREALTRAGF